jgi:hypothetical protein
MGGQAVDSTMLYYYCQSCKKNIAFILPRSTGYHMPYFAEMEDYEQMQNLEDT